MQPTLYATSYFGNEFGTEAALGRPAMFLVEMQDMCLAERQHVGLVERHVLR